MRIAELVSLLPASEEAQTRFFALRERDVPRRYYGDKIIQFPQQTKAQKWMVRFVLSALQAGLPSRQDERTGWKKLEDPVRWVTDNWERAGGSRHALRKKPQYDGSYHPLKRYWWQLERRYRNATRRYGRTIWEAPDGRLIFAHGDGGAGSPVMKEAMGQVGEGHMAD